MSGDGGVGPNRRVPHYAQPTTVSVLPTYINEEQDMIRNAFQTGNFRSLNMLPSEIKTNFVNEARANHVDSNITSAISHAPFGSYKVAGKEGPRGLFQEFEYIPSPYSLVDELKAQNSQDDRAKIKSIGTKPFAYPSVRPSLQVPEMDYDHELEHRDPYDESQNVILREKWLEKSKILHGPFVPSTGNQLLSKTNRAGLPDIMRALATQIDTDWDEAEFQVYRDVEDLIIIEFEVKSLDSEKGLLAYMNMMTQTNDVISESGLSKVVELWNHNPRDGSVYYAFKPPWVKQRASDAYYTLHPERRNFRARAAEEAMQQQMADKQKQAPS